MTTLSSLTSAHGVNTILTRHPHHTFNELRRGYRFAKVLLVLRINVPAVELIEDDGGVLAAELDELLEVVSSNHLARRVARVRRHNDRESLSMDVLLHLLDVELVAVLLLEDRRDGDEALERAEDLEVHATSASASDRDAQTDLLVGGVVGDLVGAVDVADDGGDAGQPGASTGHDAHILVRVLGRLALAVHVVVEICDCGAERCGGTVSSATRQTPGTAGRAPK